MVLVGSLSSPAFPLPVLASWLCSQLRPLHPWTRLPAAQGDPGMVPWWQLCGVPWSPSLACPGTRAGTLWCSALGAPARGAGGILLCFPSPTQVAPARQWQTCESLALSLPRSPCLGAARQALDGGTWTGPPPPPKETGCKGAAQPRADCTELTQSLISFLPRGNLLQPH